LFPLARGLYEDKVANWWFLTLSPLCVLCVFLQCLFLVFQPSAGEFNSRACVTHLGYLRIHAHRLLLPPPPPPPSMFGTQVCFERGLALERALPLASIGALELRYIVLPVPHSSSLPTAHSTPTSTPTSIPTTLLFISAPLLHRSTLLCVIVSIYYH
jgi:hypothetical protein